MARVFSTESMSVASLSIYPEASSGVQNTWEVSDSGAVTFNVQSTLLNGSPSMLTQPPMRTAGKTRTHRHRTHRHSTHTHRHLRSYSAPQKNSTSPQQPLRNRTSVEITDLPGMWNAQGEEDVIKFCYDKNTYDEYNSTPESALRQLDEAINS